MSNIILDPTSLSYSAGSEFVSAAGSQAVKMITPNTAPDWTGTGEQPSTAEKTGLMSLKVLLTVGTTVAVITLPHICIPIAVVHQLAGSAVAACLVKGAIAGSSNVVQDALTKQINGNYTPDQAKRKDYTDTMTNVTTALSVATVITPHAEEIKCIAELVESGAVFAYDQAPEKATNTVDKIKNFFSIGK